LKDETEALRKEAMKENRFLEIERNKVEKREKILTDHLKERTDDLNQLEVKFCQEERILEKEIISLKIQIEEAKRTKEVMNI
jgi:hypothetical protein